MAWLVVVLALSAGGIAAWSLSRGQDGGPASARRADDKAIGSAQTAPAPRVSLDDRRLTPLGKQMFLSLQGGASWLARAHQVDGHFLYSTSFIPALNTSLEGESYLHQLAAAFALARAARFTGNEEHLAKARQAVSVLLLDTVVDPSQPGLRYTRLPSVVVNRLATAGLLVMAINELNAPAPDLLKQSEQLCTFIRTRQRADGSLSTTDDAPTAAGGVEPDASYFPAMALYGLMVSQRYQPAAWKTDLVRKAMRFYQPWWRAHKSMALVPWHTAAYAEGFLLTREQAFADAVCEMNDWLCSLQHVDLDRDHPFWIGGFMRWIDGKAVATEPDVSSAAYAESLAEACRVVGQLGDAPRYQRYLRALESCLQYLVTLQYSQANTQHFADWYRSRLLGGFHASQTDGSLRVDFTQHAVCALEEYLRCVAKVGG
jgi:hypothetical protein